MGWEGDLLMPPTGAWVIKNGQVNLGVIAIWWANEGGPGAVHVQRIHPVPLPDNCAIALAPNLGTPPNGSPNVRRDWFKNHCWPKYKQDFTDPGSSSGWKAREWQGNVQDISNLLTASATGTPLGDIQ